LQEPHEPRRPATAKPRFTFSHNPYADLAGTSTRTHPHMCTLLLFTLWRNA
jgi:hypothetical protein